MEDVKEFYQDLAIITTEQGGLIDRIEENIVEADKNIDDGKRNLIISSQISGGCTRFICIIALCVLIIVVIFILAYGSFRNNNSQKF